jgi:hypothetical protein
MFQQRQLNEIYTSIEVSATAAASPGAITNTSLVQATNACVIPGTTNAATFALGDVLIVQPPASAALNGVEVKAFPTATAGTCNLVFLNNTGGTVTPTASTVYKIIATRVAPGTV